MHVYLKISGGDDAKLDAEFKRLTAVVDRHEEFGQRWILGLSPRAVALAW
jgi:hypothetical protein